MRCATSRRTSPICRRWPSPTWRSARAEELRDADHRRRPRSRLPRRTPAGRRRGFQRRLDEGRGRLTLIANEIARAAAQVLAEHAIALRKLKDARPPKEVADDVQAQLARLCPQALRRRHALGATRPPAALPEGDHAAAGQAARRPGPRRPAPGRAAADRAALPAPAGRAQGRARRAARGVPLAARGVARQPVRAGAAHAAAGQRQAAREGLAAAEPLNALRASAARTIATVRGVAQPGSATGLGPVGRRFESSHPDQRRIAVAAIVRRTGGKRYPAPRLSPRPTR